MPGPFPGMDPYLEHPDRWPGLHSRLIAELSSLLDELLPPRYAVEVGERVYVVQSGRSIYPDLMVVRETEPAPSAPGGAVLVAERDAPRILRTEPEERREPFIEIRALGETEVPVTVIELLSPSNKSPGSEGRDLYQQKQVEVLASAASLLEIDLLRNGAHTVAAPYAALEREMQPEGGWDYLVCLHRAWMKWQYEYWPIRVRQRLPRTAVPLAQEHGDVVLDLQQALDRCYDRGRYAGRIDYRRDPPTPFRPEDAEWAEALLREKGLRE
jgi:hypothetical protein